MERFLKVFLSPMAFAIGFLWPLAAQSLLALGLVDTGMSAWLTGAAIALPFGLMAQLRGSWIWIR